MDCKHYYLAEIVYLGDERTGAADSDITNVLLIKVVANRKAEAETKVKHFIAETYSGGMFEYRITPPSKIKCII